MAQNSVYLKHPKQTKKPDGKVPPAKKKPWATLAEKEKI